MMNSTAVRPQQGRVFTIKTLYIEPNPDQPRQEFEPVALAALATSLRQHGMLQPVIVRPVADEAGGGKGQARGPLAPPPRVRLTATTHYHLIAGERRWRAAQLAGFAEVPALVVDATPPQMLELALVENLQRADLSPLEEARAYEHMIHHLALTQEEVASRVGRSRASIANRLRLLNLTQSVRLALNERRITEGHARALLALEGAAQEEALTQVLRGKLSVRETERLVRRQVAGGADRGRRAGGAEAPPVDAPGPRSAAAEAAVEDALRRRLGTKVTLSQQGCGGRIVIEFYSDEELHRLFEQIVGPLDDSL